MEALATCKYLRKTARKARLVADELRGKKVGVALGLLEFGVRKAVAEDFSKVIKSAVANLQNKHSEVHVDVDDLVIKEIIVGQGPTLKRFRPRSQGRAFRILKRMCHLKVVVSN